MNSKDAAANGAVDEAVDEAAAGARLRRWCLSAPLIRVAFKDSGG